MSTTKILLAAVSSVMVLGLPAIADEELIVQNDGTHRVYIDRDGAYYDGRETRVYGWANLRPLDCGAYHYWNGARCADARKDPPDIGPKE